MQTDVDFAHALVQDHQQKVVGFSLSVLSGLYDVLPETFALTVPEYDLKRPKQSFVSESLEIYRNPRPADQDPVALGSQPRIHSPVSLRPPNPSKRSAPISPVGSSLRKRQVPPSPILASCPLQQPGSPHSSQFRYRSRNSANYKMADFSTVGVDILDDIRKTHSDSKGTSSTQASQMSRSYGSMSSKSESPNRYQRLPLQELQNISPGRSVKAPSAGSVTNLTSSPMVSKSPVRPASAAARSLASVPQPDYAPAAQSTKYPPPSQRPIVSPNKSPRHNRVSPVIGGSPSPRSRLMKPTAASQARQMNMSCSDLKGATPVSASFARSPQRPKLPPDALMKSQKAIDALSSFKIKLPSASHKHSTPAYVPPHIPQKTFSSHQGASEVTRPSKLLENTSTPLSSSSLKPAIPVKPATAARPADMNGHHKSMNVSSQALASAQRLKAPGFASQPSKEAKTKILLGPFSTPHQPPRFGGAPAHTGSSLKPAKAPGGADVSTDFVASGAPAPRDPNISLVAPSPSHVTLPEFSDSDGSSLLLEWARTPEVAQRVESQLPIDPSAVFGPMAPLDLAKIFPKRQLRARTSSGQWEADGLSLEERIAFAKSRGFAAPE